MHHSLWCTSFAVKKISKAKYWTPSSRQSLTRFNVTYPATIIPLQHTLPRSVTAVTGPCRQGRGSALHPACAAGRLCQLSKSHVLLLTCHTYSCGVTRVKYLFFTISNNTNTYVRNTMKNYSLILLSARVTVKILFTRYLRLLFHNRTIRRCFTQDWDSFALRSLMLWRS